MSAPVVRRAVPDDAAAVAAFAERTFRDTYARYNSPADMDAHVSAQLREPHLRQALADPTQRVIVVESGSDLAAFAQLALEAAPPAVTGAMPVALLRFYVDAPWQGHGVAQRLMAAAVESATAMGGDVLWLGVWERNPRAIAFYGKSGFQRVGTADFRLGSDVQHDHVMQRRLP